MNSMAAWLVKRSKSVLHLGTVSLQQCGSSNAEARWALEGMSHDLAALDGSGATTSACSKLHAPPASSAACPAKQLSAQQPLCLMISLHHLCKSVSGGRQCLGALPVQVTEASYIYMTVAKCTVRRSPSNTPTSLGLT